MTRFGAFVAHVNAARNVYTVDDEGRILPISVELYESLPADDPRLRHVAWYYRQAQLLSLKVRGIETGFEVQKLTN